MSDAYTWWKSVYEGVRPEDLPWFSPTPDADLSATLKRLGITPGAALDLGSGPGIHAIALAKMGWKVTAIDISPGAVRMASRFAVEAGVKIDFRTMDILSFQPDPNSFDLVHDRGFLHTLDPSEWSRWTDLVATALKPLGTVIAKEFTYNPKRHFGPRGFTKLELQNVLDSRFKIHSIEQSGFRGPRFEAAAFMLVARREPRESV